MRGAMEFRARVRVSIGERRMREKGRGLKREGGARGGESGRMDGNLGILKGW